MRSVISSSGSIPARAGEPRISSSTTTWCVVYPRACGGTVWPQQAGKSDQGLSPRMRGNHVRVKSIRLNRGSIPACAGEPRRDRRLPCPIWVYPRACGGTEPSPYSDTWSGGLSPRVRGNQALGGGDIERGGSIPACAGEPNAPILHVQSIRVYPRVCGGTTRKEARGLIDSGLSPRVRGNHQHLLDITQITGSIPACAGEPRMLATRFYQEQVYPRVCGGTAWKSALKPVYKGLSPRVRGNHDVGGAFQYWIGSIPACAGEPSRGPWMSR